MANPSGVDLASGTTNGNTLPEFPAFEEREISLSSSASLTGGVQYAIVLKASDADGGSNIFWARKAVGTKAGGSHMRTDNEGSIWVDLDPVDAWFQTFFNTTYRDQYAPTTDGVQFDIYGTIWGAQTYTAFGSYDINKVKLKLSKWPGGSPGTLTVSIQATGAVPSKPINPTPANDATEVDFTGFTLSWEDGGGADSYNVYIGTSGSKTLVSEEQAGTSYVTTLEELEDIFNASPINQKIYWRIDAVNTEDTTTGDDWNFDARPGAVTVPTPANEANDITLDGYSSTWEAGTNANSYDLYFGTLSGFTTYVGSTSGLTFDLNSGNTLKYKRFYYWIITSVNDFGNTDSIEFTFTTIGLDPPLPDGLSFTGDPEDENNGISGTPTGLNNMITVRKIVACAENTFYYEG